MRISIDQLYEIVSETTVMTTSTTIIRTSKISNSSSTNKNFYSVVGVELVKECSWLDCSGTVVVVIIMVSATFLFIFWFYCSCNNPRMRDNSTNVNWVGVFDDFFLRYLTKLGHILLKSHNKLRCETNQSHFCHSLQL